MIDILITDDHDLVRKGIRRLLEDFEEINVVGECETGEAALNYCEHNSPPNVVLMDINMPGIGGIEAAKRIMRYDERIKIIILTAKSENSLSKHMLDNGVHGYLTKNADAQEMLDAILQVYRGKRFVADEIAQKMAMSIIEGDDVSPIDKLSPREIEILIKISQGLNNQKIVQIMNLSPKTISTHRSRIMKKLNVSNDVELARIGIKYGLVD